MRSEKVAYQDSCISAYNRLPNKEKAVSYLKYVTRVLEQRVESLYDIGDYSRCFNYASLGERLTLLDVGNKDSVTLSVEFAIWQGNTLLATHKYAQAERLLVNKVQQCKAYGSTEPLASIYNQLAQIQISKGNIPRAKTYFFQSLAYDQKFDDNMGCMQAFTNLGYYIYDKFYHNKRMALDYYKKGMACFYNSPNKTQSDKMEGLNLLTNIANIYVQNKLYDSAFRYYQLALDQIKPDLHEDDLLKMPLQKFIMIEYLTGLLLDKADAYYKLYKEKKGASCFDEAIRIYMITDKLLDKIKSEQSDIQSKLFWTRDNHRLYDHAIEACFSFGGKTDEAFYFFEKSRATLLNDQLTEEQFLGDKDMMKQAVLKNKIFQLQKQLNTSGLSLENHNEIQNKLLQYNEALSNLQQTSKTRNGQAFQQAFDSSSTTIQKVQKTILKDHHALIELFEGDSAVYMMLITPRQVHFSRISKADFDSTLERYLAYISDPVLMNRHSEKYYAAAKHLYDLLFCNNPLPPKGRIIVSPDGRYFPFEALITSNRKLPAYFLYDYAVSYTYSARYLLIVNKYKRKPASGTKTLLGIAPVMYPYDTSLSDLPDNARSVREVSAYFPTADTMMYGNATKAGFLQNFYKYKINYLSTHASDSGSMGEPVIYFADEPMSLSELVAETRPVTELVIASACKTGLGKVYRGEGVYNFSRGFASVGIPACVNNLWSVQAASANRLIKLFCKYIEQGEPTDIALQKAKIEFIESSTESRRFPYHWASSILSGKADVIASEQPSGWRTIVLLSLLGAIIGAVSIYLIKRRDAMPGVSMPGVSSR